MPQYLFYNEQTQESRFVFFKMNDEKIYNGEDGSEIGLWTRRWTKPYASVDSVSNVNPFDLKKMVEKTGNMKGSIGDLWDASKEASEKRSHKLGHEDPVKRDYFDKYAKENKVKHYQDRPAKIENKHAVIDFTAKPEKSKD